MALPNTQFKFNDKNSAALVEYVRRATELLYSQFSLRASLQYVDQQYMREGDRTKENRRAVIANAVGDKTRFQNITVPIMMPQVEAAVSYLTQIFLTGYPIFGVATSPKYADAALMIETINANNSKMTGWVAELIKFFRDGLKYNLAGAEVDWVKYTTPSFETDLTSPLKVKQKDKVWSGNKIRAMDMYNTIFDPRVDPIRCHIEGEFAGYIELFSRIKLKQFINDLHGIIPPQVAVNALEAGFGPVSGQPQWFGYYQPEINMQPLRPLNSTNFDWMAWANLASDNKNQNIRYQNMYEIVTLYARILPADFDLRVPEANTPQVWKFIVVNRQVLLYGERMTNAHPYLPIIISQPLTDGLRFQTKSFGQNVIPFQDLASAHWNADIASKRRLVTDRVLYDPSRIKEKDINSSNPAAKIPVRPAAYGKPLSEAVYAFPFRDDQAQSLVQNSEMIIRFANLVNGQNPAQQGQFVKGNKTRKEFSDIMGHSDNRNLLIALTLEYTFFTAVKEIILINILQKQDADELYNSDKKKQVKIDPLILRQAVLEFTLTDGILPSEKVLSTELLGATIQAISNSPTLAAGYDVPPMFSYLMKQQGLDLRPFEKSAEQRQYEQALNVWMQAVQMVTTSSNFKGLSADEIAKIVGERPTPPEITETANPPKLSLQETIAQAAGATQ